jgi:subtilisin family serine protease
LKRNYVMRGKRIEVDELENLAAVKLKTPRTLREDISGTFGEIVRAQSVIPQSAGWVHFARAGWVLVRPNQRLSQALDGTAPAPWEASAVQRIFLHSGGRLYLGLDQLVVRLHESMAHDDAVKVLDRTGLKLIRQLTFAPNLFQVRAGPGGSYFDTVRDMSARAEFAYAEPQFIEHFPPRFAPTDPKFGLQWHLKNTGQMGNDNYAGNVGCDICAEPAWDIARGAGVRIAIIDNGFDLTDPDLAPAVDGNSGYFDEDDHGLATFYPGPFLRPDMPHGSFCAGMALARASNGAGGCGVANEADFIAIACMDDQTGSQVTLARAVAYAANPTKEVKGASAQDGADVISCSLGCNDLPIPMTQCLQDAIDFAVTSGRNGLGTPVFWSTQNALVSISRDEIAAYGNIIAVGSSTRLDLRGPAASGPELEFLATGEDVYNTTGDGGFGPYGGTSFAAPTAAGVAALVLQVAPKLTWQQVRQILRDSCDKIGGAAVAYDENGHNDDYGYGRVNAYAAVQKAGAGYALG